MAERDLSDYVEVHERIQHFRDEYPEGSLRGDWTMIQVGDQHLVAYRAAAYRYPDDKAPGIGCAWELVPGRTPFTRGSELQNAETSAWGRAIVAVGASDAKRGIASREEVANRRAEREDGLPVNADGSLSRSRTTDAQKNAAGVMTSGQHAEHTQLAKPPSNAGPVERLGISQVGGRANFTPPVDDVWMDGPAGLAPQDDPEDRPGTATAQQIKDIHALYSGQFKIPDRNDRRETTRKFLGLDMLASHTQLSYRQAGDLLLAMRHKLSERAAK